MITKQSQEQEIYQINVLGDTIITFGIMTPTLALIMVLICSLIWKLPKHKGGNSR